MPAKKGTPAQAGPGSPAGGPLFLVVGFLRRPHGVQGEMIMDLHTDFPDRIKSGKKIFIGDRHEAATFESTRAHANGMLIKLRGFDTPEAAGRFRNQWVYVSAAEVPPLPKGQHYKYELLGLDVVDEQGKALGKLAEILETGANDVYIVRNDAGKDILLPAIPSVILDLDMDRRLMRVHLIEGLI
jgi:16S rRNA processing protein RimM